MFQLARRLFIPLFRWGQRVRQLFGDTAERDILRVDFDGDAEC